MGGREADVGTNEKNVRCNVRCDVHLARSLILMLIFIMLNIKIGLSPSKENILFVSMKAF